MNMTDHAGPRRVEGRRRDGDSVTRELTFGTRPSK